MLVSLTGERVGMRPNKEHINPGKTRRDGCWGGRGTREHWGTKRGQFTSNLRRGRTIPVTAGGRQVSGIEFSKGKCHMQNVSNSCRMNDE